MPKFIKRPKILFTKSDYKKNNVVYKNILRDILNYLCI